MDAPDDEKDLTDILRDVERHYERSIRSFNEMIEKLEAGEEITAGEATKRANALHAATQTLITIRIRIYDERKRQTGAVAGYALDLDDARHKVGCLLDRLRAHRGPEGLSG